MQLKTGEPFDVPRFRALLQTTWLGEPTVYHRAVSSTMDIARAIAVEGAAAGTIVIADQQLAGRGRFGRRWLGPASANLTFSLVLRPSLEQLRRLPLVAPLAIAEGVQQTTGLRCSIKWPNDVEAGGCKLAGVLLESELKGETPLYVICGAGINVNFDPAFEPEIAYTATSLLRETGRTHERELLLAACLAAFERLYAEPAARLRERWRARLNTLGRPVRVSFQGQVEEGIAEDVAGDGSLILRRFDGTNITLPAGEVSLRRDMATPDR